MAKEKTPQEPKEEEVVPVKRSALEELFSRLDSVEKDNKMLKEVADKARLAHYESKSKSDISIKTCRLSTYQGKVVLAWRSVHDEVWRDANGVWREKQVVEVTTEDGEKIPMDFIDFTRSVRAHQIGATITKRTTDNNGNETLTVVSENGKTHEIDVTFVN